MSFTASTFTTDMQALRAPVKAITHALATIEELTLRIHELELAAVVGDEQRRRKEREKKQRSRDKFRQTPNPNAQRVTGQSRDSHGTVTGLSRDLPPAPLSPQTPHTPRPPTDPHTPRAREGSRERLAVPQTAEREGIEWPDLSEYPTLERVKAWAEAVQVPAACAEKWHAIQSVGMWENPSGVGRPLPTSETLLRPMFNSYATAWKGKEAQSERREKARDVANAPGQGRYPGRQAPAAFTMAEATAGLSAAELKSFGKTAAPAAGGGTVQNGQ